jgi:hypothetical protein
MDQTSLFGLFVAAVTWMPIRNLTSAVRGEVLNHKKPSRTGPTELYIPLH